MKYQQKIITANDPSVLNALIKNYLELGWEAVGSHTALQLHAQLRYAGNQHMETEHKAEYAQTIKKEW